MLILLETVMESFHLNATQSRLKGPTTDQIIVHNQWAATALDIFHNDSIAVIELDIGGTVIIANLSWDSDFSKAAMKEQKDMANHGGVAMAWFVMSVLQNFEYVEQTEIGEGVDYRFRKVEPSDDELNFLDDFHYVEVSGILQESKTNTLKGRIKDKHDQILRGSQRDKPSSVIVTLFSQPKTVKEIHR
ncbi:MAG: hypothetical protein M0Q38_06425 [Bacteroidales bacterium]|jgi:hypothetical protein|nr:hypothetical protein [Bacteroidales bacterium]